MVGASNDQARGGHRILRNLLERFEGPVYPVNPNLTEVLGEPAYPSVASIADPVDLAVVFIPAPAVPDVVRDCVAKGVPAICILSGGFADGGREGLRLQREIEDLVKGTATRIWGPNCAGYVSTDPALSTSFVITPGDLEPGNVALVAQSGMMAAALLVQIFTERMFRVSKACSIGNKCDVDESDLLEFLALDPHSDVIALYLEGVRDGERFVAALDRVTARANVLALMGGQTETGAQTMLSHTGSIASDRDLVSGALRQRGVFEVHDFMELVEVAAAISILPTRNAGRRVGMLTFSGAAGVVTADLFDRHGLVLAELSPHTVQRLAEIYPEWLQPTNPVDVWSTVERRGLEVTLEAGLRAVVDDEQVDSVLFVPLAFSFFRSEQLDPMLQVARACGKPIVSWVFGEKDQVDMWSDRLAEAGIPVCRTLATAVKTLAALALRDRALERARRLSVESRRTPGADVGRLWTSALAEGAVTVNEVDAKRILACYGVPCAEELVVRTVDSAVGAASRLGYPVVVKVLGQGLGHKTEIGGVRLGLESAAAVESAAFDLLAVATAQRLAAPGLVVQRMERGGFELIIGARRNPGFGPVVLLGLGGVFVEVLADIAVRPAPLTSDDAREMISELRLAALLRGGRGRPPADLDALVEVLLAMSDAILDAPDRVGEIEVNPLILGAASGRSCAVDALIVARVEHAPTLPAERAGGASSTEDRCLN